MLPRCSTNRFGMFDCRNDITRYCALPSPEPRGFIRESIGQVVLDVGVGQLGLLDGHVALDLDNLE
eukprot:3347120-Pyramimonas_sp.AAC.1